MIEDKDIKIGAVVEIEEKDFRLDTTRCVASRKGLFKIVKLPMAPGQEVKLSPALDASYNFPADFLWSFPKEKLKEIATLADTEELVRKGQDVDGHGSGEQHNAGRIIDNAEDVATSRQVLADIVQWFRDGTVCLVKYEPFNDEWLNGVTHEIWSRMREGHYEERRSVDSGTETGGGSGEERHSLLVRLFGKRRKK